MSVRRNLKLIWMLFKFRLSHMMVYRLNFFGAFFVDGSMFMLELVVFSAIYGNTQSIGGWSQAEMIVFVGTFSLINALSMATVFFGVIQLPGLIVTGELDQYLTKPMNPLLRISLERINPGSIMLVVLSFFIIGYGMGKMASPVSAGRVIGYSVMVVLMSILWCDMELILRCIPFFAASASAVADQMEGSVITLCFRVPGTLLKGGFKLLFYFVLPYGVMATIPTQVMAGTLSPVGIGYGVLIVVMFTAFAVWLWKCGLKHYSSASS